MSLFKPFCLSSDFLDGNRYCITYDSSTVHSTFEIGLLNMEFICASKFSTLIRKIRLYLTKLQFEFTIIDNSIDKDNEIQVKGIGKRIPNSKIAERIIKKIKTVLSYCVFQNFKFNKVKKIFQRYYSVEGNVFLRKFPSFLNKNAAEENSDENKILNENSAEGNSDENKILLESQYFKSKLNLKTKIVKGFENDNDKEKFMEKLDRFMYIIDNFVFTKKIKVNERLMIETEKPDDYSYSINSFICGKIDEINYIQNLGRRNYLVTAKPEVQYGKYKIDFPIINKKKHYKKIIEIEGKEKQLKNYVPQVIKYLYIKTLLKKKNLYKKKNRSKAKL